MADAAAVVAAARTALRESVGDEVLLGPPQDLGGSPRSLVVRVPVVAGAGLPPSVVVKAHLDEGVWVTSVREAAALDVLTTAQHPGTPRLLAVAADPPLVVLEDLGDAHGDLAASLLGTDAAAAGRAVSRWAAGLGRLHAATAGKHSTLLDAFTRHAARLGRPAPPLDDMRQGLDTAAAALAELLPRLGVAAPDEVLDDVRRLPDLLSDEPSLHALTPGDVCPDNNVLRADRVVLLDLEGAAYRHLGWDAAYLRVPWPSCWCAWSLPDEVAAEALEAWRSEVRTAAPAVDGADFEADVEVAVAGWAAVSVGWFLPGALDDADTAPGGARAGRRAPGRRVLVQQRLRQVAEGSDPRLAGWREVAAAAAEATTRLWGDLELPLAPAFRG